MGFVHTLIIMTILVLLCALHIPGFSSPLSYVFWRMRLAVRKKWQIQVRSGNCVCPIMMDDCKCGKTITHCVVVTPLSPVNGPSVSRFLAHAQL